jgi:myo-inositol-1(or 4)-monophosphatase
MQRSVTRTVASAEGVVAGSAEAAPWADELAFSLELAGRAGAVLMAHYERLEQIDYKSARDVVTEADHLSEALILEAIRARYPDDAILAEETGEHRAVAGEAPTSGRGRVWIVDPLDGTVNYANGLPVFCVSIGLVADGVPAVGVILDPSRSETFAATAAGPALLNGRPVRASLKDKLSDYVISVALNGRTAPTRARNVRKAIRISRNMGSAALALAYVATGRFDAFIQQGGLSAWDVAAAGLIAERGGATVTSMAGGPWFDLGHSPKSIGILAAPPAHHPRLLELAR